MSLSALVSSISSPLLAISLVDHTSLDGLSLWRILVICTPGSHTCFIPLFHLEYHGLTSHSHHSCNPFPHTCTSHCACTDCSPYSYSLSPPFYTPMSVTPRTWSCLYVYRLSLYLYFPRIISFVGGGQY